MWLLLQSDKGLSSVRLAEILGVSQPTAWRMGHALRLMVARENMLDGTVEIDHFHLGEVPESGRMTHLRDGAGKIRRIRRKRRSWGWCSGRPTSRPAPAGDTRAAVVTGLSLRAAERAIEIQIETHSHLMSDEAKAFMAIARVLPSMRP